ncbi:MULTISPECIES: helix-turn-helix domain-containing protein [Providencia]|uniref:helix-turn-helix domain-containing protein n=1 Tax=Providencia TaxID=586 RepID=UPI001980FEA8|nr:MULTISPECIES: helix-turn-helix transcriptional regulator [Providencia]HEC8326905.1 helix-turn-helix transcriptional regulator [Providencia rettgeri]MBN4864740.1 helix-turn-helix transcriptional regulator [Providencia stuartii]MBN4873814.1 helix-turn-helix transcriptional regulator [Providencia stuartii]MBN4878505.1 helix-turn-helix transcriptional regulator [Providencia stuartii]MBN4883262.1 helix-turn-helix transcriptional regulator [Providencia stuartii]
MNEHSSFIRPNIFNKKIGCFIRNKRKRMDITGKDLGVMLNVSQQQVSRYENGITNITVTMLNDILKILDVSWEEFLSFNELNDNS